MPRGSVRRGLRLCLGCLGVGGIGRAPLGVGRAGAQLHVRAGTASPGTRTPSPRRRRGRPGPSSRRTPRGTAWPAGVEVGEERAVLEDAAGRRAPPPDCCAWASCWANSALAGSFSAAWNSGPARCRFIASAMLPGTVENRIDRNTAVPMVPPIWRVKVAVEVATPISRGLTAFCTARVSGWKLNPRPRPKKTITTIVCHSGRLGLDVVEDEERQRQQGGPDDREVPVAAGLARWPHRSRSSRP